jgi:hypothetical protein
MVTRGASDVQNGHQPGVVPDIVRSLVGGESRSQRKGEPREVLEINESVAFRTDRGLGLGRLGCGVARRGRLVFMIAGLSLGRKSTVYSVLSARGDQ